MGKFEFKKGNTLASLAEALLINFDSIYGNTEQSLSETLIGEDVPFPITDIFSLGSAQYSNKNYEQLVEVLIKLLPYYRYYFDHYLPSKKLVVLSLL